MESSSADSTVTRWARRDDSPLTTAEKLVSEGSLQGAAPMGAGDAVDDDGIGDVGGDRSWLREEQRGEMPCIGAKSV